MKKNLFLCFFSTLVSSSFAQNVLYSETFNSGTIPANMQVIDEDGLAHHPSTAYIDKAWKAVGGTRFAIETDSFAVSTSYNEPNGVPLGAASDWLITPAITIGANAIFKWNAKVFDAPPYADGYEIRVANAPTIAAMNATTPLYSIAAENQNWTAHTASLAAYAGQTIYIAIHNNTNEGFLLGIDDLTVQGGLPVATNAQATDICKISVMPNPTTGAFQLKINLETPQNIRIELRNIQGQTIETFYQNKVLNDYFTIDSLTAQVAGIYYAVITTENGSVDTIRIAVVK